MIAFQRMRRGDWIPFCNGMAGKGQRNPFVILAAG
jgi:hypothetical protein